MKNKKLDLHIHTKYSDGEFDENEIFKRITDANIKEFAICDHDTLEGSLKVSKLVLNKPVIFHSGIELTCRVPNFSTPVNVHILALDFDYENENIISLVNTMAKFRLEKLDRMIKFIEKIYNFKFNKTELDEELKNTNAIGKPHILKIMSRHMNINRKNYYDNMNNLDTDDLKLDAISAIKNIHLAGGKAILAHPIEIMDEHKLNYAGIDSLVNYLTQNGLDGLETHHSKHSQTDIIEFSKIANKYNLLETHGSDYHGPTVKPTVKLGVCFKDCN